MVRMVSVEEEKWLNLKARVIVKRFECPECGSSKLYVRGKNDLHSWKYFKQGKECYHEWKLTFPDGTKI